MSIDYEVRRSVARWCRDVALEDPGTASHVERRNIARNLATNVCPYVPEQDTLVPNIVFLVRAFAGEEADAELIDATVGQILAVYVTLGALQE